MTLKFKTIAQLLRTINKINSVTKMFGVDSEYKINGLTLVVNAHPVVLEFLK